MDQRRSPGSEARATSTTPLASSQRTAVPASQQVSWEPVHAFLQAALAQANTGPLPWAGTPAWCELADGDPRKLLALAAAGEHHVLRVEACQAARAEASRAVSNACNWARVSRDIQQRRSFYMERPWLRRTS
ncbi:DUF2742 domain-containing protein [Mycobacterium camsae]|uniref:DUF2742 domain-containing protein n=1 Tax=Mycobacterium gordonae TaxID=1778 RepID=UPI00197DE08C|nr:DUF2742 domain-containing protein [Mycobacterium gordonae]